MPKNSSPEEGAYSYSEFLSEFASEALWPENKAPEFEEESTTLPYLLRDGKVARH